METPQLEISALTGILDAGMASAAAQLSGLLNEAISLKVAHLAISPLEQVLPLLRLGNVQVACIWQQMTGSVNGSAMLLLHPEDSLALIGALLGNVPSMSEAANGVVQQDALIEIGNIIVSSCICALSSQLGMPIALSVPGFFEQRLTSLFDDALSDLDGVGPHAPAQVVVMSVALLCAGYPVNATLVLMLGQDALTALMQGLDRMLSGQGMSGRDQP